jgi:hypothetical protein
VFGSHVEGWAGKHGVGGRGHTSEVQLCLMQQPEATHGWTWCYSLMSDHLHVAALPTKVPSVNPQPHPAGRRPASSIALWGQLLPVWERYRRWLDLVAARCGLLGARVAAARQLAEPGLSGRSTAALLPHLRNKGLLLFRGHVLLVYGLRRPLQVRWM